MPSKGSKAASRQAKMRQKRRRGKGGPQIMDSGPTAPPPEAEVDEDAQAAAPKPRPQRRQTPVAKRAAPPSRRAAQEATAAEARPSYLGTEIRQIGVLTGFIAVILAVLTFVLGG